MKSYCGRVVLELVATYCLVMVARSVTLMLLFNWFVCVPYGLKPATFWHAVGLGAILTALSKAPIPDPDEVKVKDGATQIYLARSYSRSLAMGLIYNCTLALAAGVVAHLMM